MSLSRKPEGLASYVIAASIRQFLYHLIIFFGIHSSHWDFCFDKEPLSRPCPHSTLEASSKPSILRAFVHLEDLINPVLAASAWFPRVA